MLAVTGGSHHGHKLVARQTGVSLESLSEVYARKKSASRWLCGLFASFAITKTAPATCLDQQNVQFSSSGTSKKTPNTTPGAAVLYIRGARVRWGRRRERRETRKFSGLDSLGGASVATKSDRYPVFVRFCRATYAALSHPAWRSHLERAVLAVSGGGGEVRFFGYFWVPEKIRGASRHRGVRPCA